MTPTLTGARQAGFSETAKLLGRAHAIVKQGGTAPGAGPRLVRRRAGATDPEGIPARRGRRRSPTVRAASVERRYRGRIPEPACAHHVGPAKSRMWSLPVSSPATMVLPSGVMAQHLKGAWVSRVVMD